MVKNHKKDYQEIKAKLKTFFDKIFTNHPIKPDKYLSLRKICLKFNVSRNFVKNYLLTKYFPSKFIEDPIVIVSSYWPKSRSENSKMIQLKLIEYFSSQLKRYYPDEIENINSIGQLCKKFSIGFISVKKWLMNYLIKVYKSDIANKIYNEIFPTLSSKSPTYSDIELFINNRHGKIQTTENEWNNMVEQPTKRYVRIKCKKGHKWDSIIHGLIYDNRWCPTCNESRGEQLTRMYMEAIFSAISKNSIYFPKISLHKALGIDINNGGRMYFDGYSAKVKIKNKLLRIAFEYDGKQHDIYPNSIHKSFSEFKELQRRDKMKDDLCKLPLYKTILIRIKQISGFEYHNHHLFVDEIILQFYKKSGIKISDMPLFKYNELNNSLEEN